MNNTEKRLRKAGFGTEIDNGYIVIESTSSICVGVYSGQGFCDCGRTALLRRKVIKALETENATWSGFRAAGGHWYLRKNYDPKPLAAAYADHAGDWSDY